MKCIKILLLFVVINSFSQIKQNGLVVDISNKPISFTSIQLVDKETDLTSSFIQTNEKGEFSLVVNSPNKKHYLKIRLIGYVNQNIDLQDYKFKTIQLQESAIALKEVVIKQNKNQFEIEDDTITYNLKRVTDNTETNLKEIVEKLPGLSIGENKKISFQGKQIDKVTIDGNDFFGKKHEMSTENLSASAIKGIKILKNYKDIDDISSEKTGKIVLDVTLKKDYRNRIVGNIDGKSGILEKYQAHTNFFKFVKKGNFALVSEFNNIGEPAINMMDYMEMSGGITQFMKNDRLDGSGNIDIDHSKTPRFVFVKNNIDARKTVFNSLNITNTFSKKTKLTGYINIDKTVIDELRVNVKTFAGDNPLVITEQNSGNSLSYLGNSYFTVSHKLKDNQVVKYVLKFNPFKDNSIKSIQQNFNIEQNNQNKKIALGQNLSYRRQLTENLYSKISISSDISNGESLTKYSSNNNFLGLNFQDKKELVNKGKDKLNQLNTNLYTYYRINNDLGLKTSINYAYLSNIINTESSINTFDNFMDRNKNTLSVYNEIKRKFNWGLDAAFGIKYLNNTIEINNSKKTQNWLLPNLLLSYDFDDRTLSFNCRHNKENISIFQSNKNDIIYNYNTIIKLNSNIFEPIVKTNYGINYKTFNYENNSMFYVNTSYEITENAVSFDTKIKANYIEQKYIRQPSNTRILKLNYRASFKKLSYDITGDISHTITQSFFNGLKNKNAMLNQSVLLILGSNLKNKFLNGKINFKYTRSLSENHFKRLNYAINTFYGKPEIYGKVDKVFWKLSCQSTLINSNAQSQNINALNFSVQWKFKKYIELFFKGNNILNLKGNPLIAYQNTPAFSQFTRLEQLEGSVLVGMRYHF